MRDIVVSLVVLTGVLYSLKKPYIGVLLWSWLSYMNPHRLCYGFAYSMPFAYITAIFTMFSLLFSKEDKKIPSGGGIRLLLILFLLWTAVTTVFAFHPEFAQEQFIKFVKIQIPIFLTLMVLKDKQRIHSLLWVISISIGYFGIKGGIYTVLSGGGGRVYGPPDSFIEENNALAVATLMVMPIMVYLGYGLKKSWQKKVMLFCLISMGFSVLGSQSRGAFLAIVSVSAYFWFQSKNKLPSTIGIAFFGLIAAFFLPESWYERMNTIDTYDEDESAMGRINAWILALNVANHNFFGGGFNLWSETTYSHYLITFDPGHMKAFVAHSIYFSVLGEQGWVGLGLFLVLIILCWYRCGELQKKCSKIESVAWIAELARMIKVSLIAYCTGGTFLSLSYFDLPWTLFAVVILLKFISDQASLDDIYPVENFGVGAKRNRDYRRRNSIYPLGVRSKDRGGVNV